MRFDIYLFHPFTIIEWPSQESSAVVQGSFEKDAWSLYWNSHSQILFHQWFRPQTSTGSSPAELLMGRRPPSLQNLYDSISRVRGDSRTDVPKTGQFSIHDSVSVQNFSQQYPQRMWLFGEIVSVCGPVYYTIRLSDNRTLWHVDHIFRWPSTQPSDSTLYPTVRTST